MLCLKITVAVFMCVCVCESDDQHFFFYDQHFDSLMALLRNHRIFDGH